MKGTVKWFDPKKGFGFIKSDDNEDVFVHHTAINMDGFKTIDEGDVVDFDVTNSPKGMKAENVTKI